MPPYLRPKRCPPDIAPLFANSALLEARGQSPTLQCLDPAPALCKCLELLVSPTDLDDFAIFLLISQQRHPTTIVNIVDWTADSRVDDEIALIGHLESTLW
jgi:hypothetical protein